MNHPQLIINYLAIGSSVLAGMVFGFLWYGPIFGRTWGQAMGMPMDKKPDPGVMKKAMILQVIGLFLTAYVLAHTSQIWRPSVWGVGEDQAPSFVWGATSAFFTWIGFYVPMQFGKVAWEGRPWKVFFINTGHDFLNLFLMSQILAHWR